MIITVPLSLILALTLPIVVIFYQLATIFLATTSRTFKEAMQTLVVMELCFLLAMGLIGFGLGAITFRFI